MYAKVDLITVVFLTLKLHNNSKKRSFFSTLFEFR